MSCPDPGGVIFITLIAFLGGGALALAIASCAIAWWRAQKGTTQ